jgi:hypothetical protein
MANYLQRIVASGARTISPAKPPVSSHALIPPVAAPVFQPATETALRADESSELMLSRHEEAFQVTEQPRVVQEHEAMPLPASPVHEPVMESGPAVPQEIPAVWPFAPILSSPSERVHAPEGLRRARPNAMPQREVIREIVKMPRKQEPQPEPKRVSGQSESLLSPTSNEIPSVPVAIPNRAQNQPSSNHEQLPAAHVPAQRIELPVDKDVIVEKTSAQALPPIKKAPIETANVVREAEAPPPVLPKLAVETHPVEVRATTSRQAIPPTVSNIVDKRKQSKISIGRIDVQVNNQLPPQPAAPQTAKTAASSNFLDTRYLSRFFLRL